LPLAEGYGFKRAFTVLAPLLVHIEQEAGHRAFHQVAVAYRAVAATAARRLCRIGSRTSDLSVFGIAVGLLRHTHRNCAEGCAPRGGTMPGMASRLCEALAPHAEKIAGSADRQSVRYVPSTWRSWLALANVDPNVTDRVFSAIGPETVSRPQIRTLGQDSDSSGGRLALIIAVLVWDRGTANSRMRDAIVRALHHQDRDQVLKRTAELAQRGAVAGAYEAWTLPGLRAPFFTKWLWAARLSRRSHAASSTTSGCGTVLGRSAGTAFRRPDDATGHRATPPMSSMSTNARERSLRASAARTSSTRCFGSTGDSMTCSHGSCDWKAAVQCGVDPE
jgi:hypothetical protein